MFQLHLMENGNEIWNHNEDMAVNNLNTVYKISVQKLPGKERNPCPPTLSSVLKASSDQMKPYQ